MAKNSALHLAFCANVRARRTALGLTQKDVANALGVSQPSYAQIEMGRRIPGLELIERVSEALDVPATELLRTPQAVA